jgi:hypothetical protein
LGDLHKNVLTSLFSFEPIFGEEGGAAIVGFMLSGRKSQSNSGQGLNSEVKQLETIWKTIVEDPNTEIIFEFIEQDKIQKNDAPIVFNPFG